MGKRNLLIEELTESPAAEVDLAAEIGRLRTELKALQEQVKELTERNSLLARQILENEMRRVEGPSPFSPQPHQPHRDNTTGDPTWLRRNTTISGDSIPTLYSANSWASASPVVTDRTFLWTGSNVS